MADLEQPVVGRYAELSKRCRLLATDRLNAPIELLRNLRHGHSVEKAANDLRSRTDRAAP